MEYIFRFKVKYYNVVDKIYEEVMTFEVLT